MARLPLTKKCVIAPQACLLWPRSGSECVYLRNAPPPPPPSRRNRQNSLSGADTFDEICASDRAGVGLPGFGADYSTGGFNPKQWLPGPSNQYCQWVAWRDDDFNTQDVFFSVQSGSKTCIDNGETAATIILRRSRTGCHMLYTRAYRRYAQVVYVLVHVSCRLLCASIWALEEPSCQQLPTSCYQPHLRAACFLAVQSRSP